MEAIAGTSGGSDGGGDQPPNKRSRMEADSDNTSEEDFEDFEEEEDVEDEEVEENAEEDSEEDVDSDSESSPVDALYSYEPGAVSSVTDMRLDCLKCPICNEYPRKEVYQCINGHSVCNVCIVKMPHCPICRAVYIKKVRNLAVEALLDTMTYNCSYMDDDDFEVGCRQARIPRNRRTAHEIQCDYNPSSAVVKFCDLFDSTELRFCPGSCQFRICPNSIMQDPQHNKDVIEHLTSQPHKLPYQKVKCGERVLTQFRLPSSSEEPHYAPLKLFEVYNGGVSDIIGYYVLILQVTMRRRQEYLSWTVVGLTSAPEIPNAALNRKITVKFFIEAKADPGNVARYGDGCVSNQSWAIKAMYLNEWKDIVNSPPDQRPSFSFPLPVCFLREHYKLEGDRSEMAVSFG